jgi:hypothetical protein
MVQSQSRGKHIMTMYLALVYTCTFDEAWLRARFVTRSRVACWMLRCRERRNMTHLRPSIYEFAHLEPDDCGAEPMYVCNVASIHGGGWLANRFGILVSARASQADSDQH